MSSDGDSVRVRDYSLASNDTAQPIKNVVKDIHKSSFVTGGLIYNLVSSGALEEIIRASAIEWYNFTVLSAILNLISFSCVK